MPTTIEVYKGHQLTVVPQPGERFLVEIVPIGGGGKPFLTQDAFTPADALAKARRLLDSGFSG